MNKEVYNIVKGLADKYAFELKGSLPIEWKK